MTDKQLASQLALIERAYLVLTIWAEDYSNIDEDHQQIIDDLQKEIKRITKELEQKVEQEPVAWMYINEDGECEQIEYGTDGCNDPDIQPLYTAPPRKPWVRLTDADLMKEFGYTDELLRDTAYRVEQILKGRNT
jgi:hypothetical protein